MIDGCQVRFQKQSKTDRKTRLKQGSERRKGSKKVAVARCSSSSSSGAVVVERSAEDAEGWLNPVGRPTRWIDSMDGEGLEGLLY